MILSCSDSIILNCCELAVQHAAQQAVQQIHSKSNSWSISYITTCCTKNPQQVEAHVSVCLSGVLTPRTPWRQIWVVIGHVFCAAHFLAAARLSPLPHDTDDDWFFVVVAVVITTRRRWDGLGRDNERSIRTTSTHGTRQQRIETFASNTTCCRRPLQPFTVTVHNSEILCLFTVQTDKTTTRSNYYY